MSRASGNRYRDRDPAPQPCCSGHSLACRWAKPTKSKPALLRKSLRYLGLDRQSFTYDRGTAPETRHTLGARLWRPPATKELDWDFDYEGVWQFGSFGDDPDTSLGSIGAGNHAANLAGTDFQAILPRDEKSGEGGAAGEEKHNTIHGYPS